MHEPRQQMFGSGLPVFAAWLAAFFCGLLATPAHAEQPNILWITAEDMSPDLGSYGDTYADTPRLDALAREAIRYARAFATAPVCSPARSCLITGMEATSTGTQHLRSSFPLPRQVRGFAALLRENGYYCTNNVKTDYNTSDEGELIEDCWDDNSVTAHWRGRRPGQPFFAVFNLMTTHQSRSNVWPEAQFEREIGAQLDPNRRHDPAEAPVPPYYPDTPVVRRTLARYYDCVSVLDTQVGRLLDELKADGLADSTIVFFYGDHGRGLPRGKRVLYDSGLQVPLLIRFPKDYADWAPSPPGSVSDRLVSFVDFAPTVLRLAGVEVPPYMHGIPFLRDARPPREYVFGARDRVDEAYDLARSVRDDRYLYIRNMMPHLAWAQPEGYSDQAAIRHDILRLAAQGRLDEHPRGYTEAPRALEELYDTLEDPHQIHNLAGRPEYADVQSRMRSALDAWILEVRDLAFLPEAEINARRGPLTPWEFARGTDYPLERLLRAAGRVGNRLGEDEAQAGLADSVAGVRYWTAMALQAVPPEDQATRQRLREALRDDSPSVRIEAAGAVLNWDSDPTAIAVLTRGLQSDDLDVALHAARTLQLAGPRAAPAQAALREALTRARESEDGEPFYLFIRFALEAALED